jgi:hypothetical protein
MICEHHHTDESTECPACAAMAELHYLTELPHRANDPMHAPRIAELCQQLGRVNTDSAIEWARSVLRRSDEMPMSDADLQEYNLALGITVDGVYQDVDTTKPWWQFWKG